MATKLPNLAKYQELCAKYRENKEDYKAAWCHYSPIHVLNHRINKLGQDPDEVWVFMQSKFLKVQPVVEVEPVLPPPSPEPVVEPVVEPVPEPLAE